MRILQRLVPAAALIALAGAFWWWERTVPPEAAWKAAPVAEAAPAPQVTAAAPAPQVTPTRPALPPSPRTPIVQPPSPRGSPTPTVVVPTPTAPPLGPVAAERCFPQTGFCIRNDQFWEYFNARGGVRTFGYPISREFLLNGSRVQFFQRLVMELQPQGVGTLNLLDPGLMPYTRINGSVFPEVDERLKNATPPVSSPTYATDIAAFIEANAPEVWNGLPVQFWTTFRTTVPEGTVPPNLVTLANLEIWGAVISPPAYDPTNQGFVYQRYQRGIMHYRQECRCTEGLLMAEWFKTLITGVGLPADLAAQAADSVWIRQYNNTHELGLSRPGQLPNTNMRFAFEPDRP